MLYETSLQKGNNIQVHQILMYPSWLSNLKPSLIFRLSWFFFKLTEFSLLDKLWQEAVYWYILIITYVQRIGKSDNHWHIQITELTLPSRLYSSCIYIKMSWCTWKRETTPACDNKWCISSLTMPQGRHIYSSSTRCSGVLAPGKKVFSGLYIIEPFSRFLSKSIDWSPFYFYLTRI